MLLQHRSENMLRNDDFTDYLGYKELHIFVGQKSFGERFSIISFTKQPIRHSWVKTLPENWHRKLDISFNWAYG